MVVLLVLAVVAGALAQGATGIGFALLVAPACALVLDADQVVGTVVGLGLLLDVAMVAQAPRAIDLRLVRTYLFAAALAVPLAVAAVDRVEADVLVVGSAVLALLGAFAVVRGSHVHEDGPWLRWVAGFASGFFGITTGMSGPPVAIETGRRRMPGLEARTSLAAFFAVVDAVSLGVNRTTVGAELGAVLVVGVAVGLLLGRRLAGRVSEHRLRLSLAGVVACSALVAIATV